MKILNLYAGIGGNRKLWGDGHNITAVEIEPTIAQIYTDHFPDDKVLVEDAHVFNLSKCNDIISGQIFLYEKLNLLKIT